MKWCREGARIFRKADVTVGGTPEQQRVMFLEREDSPLDRPRDDFQ